MSESTGEYGTREDSAGDYVDTGVGVPDRLTRLWAPYRMNYIAKGAEKENPAERPGNPFTRLPQMSDEDALIVARGETAYVVLNLYPYNPGHLLVVPYREVADLENLTPEESTEIMQLAQAAVTVIKEVSNPQGINVGFNLGRASGGSVATHLHMHIVPRWVGDANFMTIIDGTKVLPQKLKDTRALFAGAWQEHPEFPGDAHA